MYSSKPSYVFGFHGCDESLGKDVLLGKKELRYSHNDYDWLGHGVYFWENNYERARHYAEQASRRPNSAIEKPFVVSAIIDLGNCLDLLDKKWLDFLCVAYEQMVSALNKSGQELTVTNSAFGSKDFDFKKRELDCMVIRYAVELAKAKGIIFDSVRAAFWEGEELYPNAGFKTQNHIQLSVMNPNCIKGLFLPREKVDFEEPSFYL